MRKVSDTSRVLWITGAFGFLGRNLALSLRRPGHQLVGIGHGAWPDAAAWGLDFWMNGDIAPANLSLLARDQGRPDVVFHLAGGSSVGASIVAPREDFGRTVETTASLCEWLRLQAPDAALLTVSSAAVYGCDHAEPIPETAPCRPYSPYGHHKLMMEQVCRSYAEAYGLRVAMARPFSVYGRGLRKQLPWDICERLARQVDVLELGGEGDERRDWTDVTDVVRALERISELASSAAPTVNVSTGRGLEIAQVAEILTRAWGASTPARFTGLARAGDPKMLVGDGSKLTDLGFEWRTPAAAGLAAYVDWYKGQARSR